MKWIYIRFAVTMDLQAFEENSKGQARSPMPWESLKSDCGSVKTLLLCQLDTNYAHLGGGNLS